jgi:dienelactone hydrolase
MLRRDFLLRVSMAAAMPPYRGLRYRDYSRCWPETLRLWAEDAARKRDAALARIRTAAAAAARQKWARETFWSLIGGEPHRAPLNITMRGEFAREGYRVEKLSFESFPGIPIPANLYIPAGRSGPFPGVLFQCGHSLNGKSAESYQRCCQGLAKLGFLTLTIDPMGQGERTASPRAGSWLTRLGSADEEHNLPGRQMLLLGDTSTRHQLWDTIRALDVLAQHPLVDPRRIGVTGQSGGGTLSMFLAAVDERPAAIAVSSGNTENFACTGFDAPGSTDDAEQNFPGASPLGFDRWDTLYPFAPKPLLVLVSAKDYFGTYSPNYIRNGWEEFEKLRRFYTLLGGASHIAWADVPVPHALGYEARLRVYNWLLQWLQPGSARLDREPAVAPEPDETLWVSPNGSVLRKLSGRARSGWIPEHASKPPAAAAQPAPADLLAVSPPSKTLQLALLATSRFRPGHLDAVEVQSGPAMWIPAWLARPASPAKPACAVVLDPSGRNTLWQEGGVLETLATAGWLACAPDLRGIGDLRGEYARGSVRHAADHANEEAWAWAGLWLGRPVLGQRVSDILALVRALLNQQGWSKHRIVLAARGHLTVPALLAAHFDPAIFGLYLSSPLWSFRSVVDAHSYTHPLSNFVAGILHTTDLPEIARSLSPRRIVLAGALSGGGEPVSPDESSIRFLPEPDWTPAGILRRLNSIA